MCSNISLVEDIDKLVKENNFEINKIENLSDLNIYAYDLCHSKSGARYIHLSADDPNNTFCISIRTPSFNNCGTTHILEHMSLAGSKKFPSRDPFFKMYSRSVSTFMNAMTYPQHTSYPFSTINPVDFSNLSDVYLDSVFNPLLRELDFLQEGWRLEYENINDPSSPIIFKGVVFNEMKGVYSSNDNLLYRSFISNILPTSYKFDYGGEPLEIPNLKYSQLFEYHKKFYHPSNSCFVTYGSFPIENHLKYLDNFLLKYSKTNISSSVCDEPHWTESKSIIDYYPYDPLLPDRNKQITLTVGYKIKKSDPYLDFVMCVISQLLIHGPNSPFYQSLIEPHIGMDYSPIFGYIDDMKHRLFGIGLKGISETEIENVQKIISNTFEHYVENGVNPERVHETLTNMELGLKHIKTTRGLKLSLGTSTSWAQGSSPIDELKVYEFIEKFKNDFKENPKFMQEIIKKEIINNHHKIVHIMIPKSEYTTELGLKFDRLLKSHLTNLTKEDKDLIYKKGITLKKDQDLKSGETADNLPMIHINDLSRTQIKYDINQFCKDIVPVQFCLKPTNGITYFKCLIDVSGLPYMLKSYLPLFCHALSKIGAGDHDYKDFSAIKTKYVRGMCSSVSVTVNPKSTDAYSEHILFQSYCLDSNVKEMFKIWLDIFNHPHLDNEDVVLTTLLEMSEKLISSVSDSGHNYAMTSASSSLNLASQMDEKYHGLTQVSFIKRLSEERNIKNVIENFKSIASYILDRERMKCSINTSIDNLDNSKQEISLFIDSITEGTTEPTIKMEFSPKSVKKIYKMSLDVNFVSKVLPGVHFSHPDTPKIVLLSQILTSKYLHREIREKGGAYGSGLILDNQMLKFYSYRDPNIIKTISVFNSAIDWISSDELSSKDLEEAQVKCIGKLDHPIAPENYGSDMFLRSVTHEMKQKFRNGIFDTTIDEIRLIAQKYLTYNLYSISVLAKDTVDLDLSEWHIEDLTLE